MAIAKPLIIALDEVDWDTLELLEIVQAKSQAGEQPTVGELKLLVAGLFQGWTLADAGKITRAEGQQVFEAIKEQLGVPKSSDSASSAPSTTAEPPPSGPTPS